MGAAFPVEALDSSFMKLGKVVGLAWTVANCSWMAIIQSCVTPVRSEVPGCKGVTSSIHETHFFLQFHASMLWPSL